MAITAATLTSDFSGFLTAEQAGPIFEKAAEASVVQRLGTQVPLGGNGVSIPVVTGDPSAAWVDEGATKPASEGSMTLKTMSPKKLATIIVVSAEVVRANPGNYMSIIRERVAKAFAAAFDAAALHGTSSPFTADLTDTTNSVEIGTTAQASGGIYGDFVAGLGLTSADGFRVNGFALSDQLEADLLGATDTTGRPLFVDSPLVDGGAVVTEGRMIGRRTVLGSAVHSGTTRGFGGDWTQLAWGVVGGISYDVSTEASVTINSTLTSLWENNLVAVRAEAEYGLVINDTDAFVKYVAAAGS
jgi:HK97 family phage major capsid protein